MCVECGCSSAAQPEEQAGPRRVRVTVRDNGPLRIEGPIEIVTPEGELIQVVDTVVTLCRCGGSKNKPFCDGTHWDVKFSDAR